MKNLTLKMVVVGFFTFVFIPVLKFSLKAFVAIALFSFKMMISMIFSVR